MPQVSEMSVQDSGVSVSEISAQDVSASRSVKRFLQWEDPRCDLFPVITTDRMVQV